MAGQGIGERHFRLPRTVETEGADAVLIINLDLVVFGDALENYRARLGEEAGRWMKE
jgi:hypothetical protein